jgi:hypothetical protein
VLANASMNRTAIWYLNGPNFVSGVYGPDIAPGWTLEGSFDFNGDGSPDFALLDPSTRETAIWFLNGADFTSSAYGPTLAPNYDLVFP